MAGRGGDDGDAAMPDQLWAECSFPLTFFFIFFFFVSLYFF
jgi:hypothetical protein